MSDDNVIPFPKRETPACSCPIGPDRRFIGQPGCRLHGATGSSAGVLVVTHPLQPRIA